jgi:RNA polymerase Rpb3/Rpb11 dimerisation domain
MDAARASAGGSDRKGEGQARANAALRGAAGFPSCMRHTAVIQRNWQSLIKPEKLGVEPGAEPSRMATVVAEPLERGFGMTLGNAIRRILLS